MPLCTKKKCHFNLRGFKIRKDIIIFHLVFYHKIAILLLFGHTPCVYIIIVLFPLKSKEQSSKKMQCIILHLDYCLQSLIITKQTSSYFLRVLNLPVFISAIGWVIAFSDLQFSVGPQLGSYSIPNFWHFFSIFDRV